MFTLSGVLVLTLALLACTRLTAEPSELQASTVQGPLAVASDRAWSLAYDGQLDEALKQIKLAAESAEPGSPVQELGHEISTLEQNVHREHLKAQAEYEKQMAELSDHFEQGKLHEALFDAVEAYDLTDDPASLLKDPKVAALIAASEAQASEQEKQQQWLSALRLYQRLGALYEQTDRDRYFEPLRRISRRVGLLRLYAPQLLFEMYRKTAAEDGEPAPEPWQTEQEHWKDFLEGITAQLLYDAINEAAEKWVEGTSYEQLLVGGIESLEVLLSTPGLETTFPSLAEEPKIQEFGNYLILTRQQIERRVERMTEREARRIIESILEKNNATVALDEAVVVHELGDGAMARLDDFTSFVWPKVKERFERTTTQKFSGVGIQISLVDGQLTVVTPLEGTPAHKAGIRAGQRITTIDGKNTLGIDLDSAVDRITGPENTQVTLGISSPGSDEVRELTLTRQSIRIVSVKGWDRKAGGDWDYYIDPELQIGYVRMTSFGPDTADELDAAIETLKSANGINGLILDLRFNPGGRLDAAINVSDRFLSKGIIVSTTHRGFLGRPMAWSATESKTYSAFPLIVLVNDNSASASEIVSGAIKDHKRGLIVGERTFGKGSVQNVFPIADGRAYLKLTTQYYRLPEGKIIHRRPGSTEWGVEPDIHVRMNTRQSILANRARTLLDILRDDGEEIVPESVFNGPGDDEEIAEQMKLPPIKCAQDILTHGLDPQLETALLLLKTRVIGQDRG